MRGYLSHSKRDLLGNDWDFRENLYVPIKESGLQEEFGIIFPHERSGRTYNTEQLIRDGIDFLIGDVTFPHSGIAEIGMAKYAKCNIILTHNTNIRCAIGSLFMLTNMFAPYDSPEELVEGLREHLEDIKN
ncbi:MAG: hypothetical protein ACE5FT_03280 [Candidatus Nanoarchaeia archaeon]